MNGQWSAQARTPGSHVEDAGHRQHRYGEKTSRDTGHFRAAKNAQQHQQGMQLYALSHQVRREEIVLEHTVGNDENQHCPKVDA